MKNIRSQPYKISRYYLQFLLSFSSLSSAFLPTLTPSVSRRSESAIFSGSDLWLESLKARQQELDQERNRIEANWEAAKCKSTIPISLQDGYVRRLAIGNYPLLALGSHTGNIYVVNMDTGDLVAKSIGQEHEEPLKGQEELLEMLYSNYDGGGTLAIAVYESLVCSAGRQGSVQLWRIDPSSKKLISQGSVRNLEDVLVTCIDIDEEYLWVGTGDGRLQAYPRNSDVLPLALQTKPELEWKFGSSILSLSICREIGYGVVSTAEGSVQLFSTEDDDEMVAEWIPSITTEPSSTIYPRCVSLVRNKDSRYSIACGYTDGTICLKKINYKNGVLGEKVFVETDTERKQIFRKSHVRAVQCLANPVPDIILSGAQDGTIKAWNVSTDEVVFKYQFVGYKVWLGTLWTDGSRVVTDGADNSVIVHDFSIEEATEES